MTRVSFGMMPPKYKNVRTEVDGVTFDSKGEAGRYRKLALLERAGQIRKLRRQVKYDLSVNGQKVTSYRADFVYEELTDGAWLEIVEDFKGMPDQKFTIKLKLMKAIHGITVRVTSK